VKLNTVFLKLAIPIWLLFIILAIYYATKAARKHAPPQVRPLGASVNYAVFGAYAVDGDPSDLSYGMYIQLDGRPVFLDIREDQYLEQRKIRAIALNQNKDRLEESLHRFVAANPGFQNSLIASIGLHADDLEQGEVFWNPDGYTLLKGYDFV
jgi:hypothetical protein